MTASKSDTKLSTVQEAISINAETALASRDALQNRISPWLKTLLEYEGYADWKNRHIGAQLVFAADPKYEFEDASDFEFDPETQKQCDLITGYFTLYSAAQALRQTEMYFRRYPFRKGEVGREAHLKTCCELLFSRVYHFRERLLKFLIQLDRATEPKKTLPHGAVKAEFDKRFKYFLDERHNINHHAGYADVQLGAIGITDLLASADKELGWMRASTTAYRKICADWAKKTRYVADQLDLYVGLVASLMMARCEFLPPDSPSHSLGSKEISDPPGSLQ